MKTFGGWRNSVALVVGALLVGFGGAGAVLVAGLHPALAQSADVEKQAFEAAKELGTVEAWDAFLSSYSNGFYSDLARAYVKKLAEQPAAAAPLAPPPAPPSAPGPGQVFDYPMVAGTWGGIVRSGPGRSSAKVASLAEGEEVTLMGPPVPVTPNDYPWFKISFRNGVSGYMWGGLLCSTGAERPDLFKLCPFTPYRDVSGGAGVPAKPVTRTIPSGGSGGPSWCRSPGNAAESAICGDADLLSLDSVLNVAYRRARFDSPGSVAEIEREQKRWLGRRNLCDGDTECLRRRYNEQIPFLESFYAN